MRGLVLVLVLASAAPAHADEIAQGKVVKVEAHEIYVNLGDAVVAEGAPLRLRRPIRLKHPVTGAYVSDWLPLGDAQVTEVGHTMCMAALDAALLAQVKEGDLAEVYVAKAEPAPAVAAPSPADGPTVDPATAEVLALWQAEVGAPLDGRIAAWERFLGDHPASSYAAALRDDLVILRAARDRVRPPDDTASAPELGGLEHRAPATALAATAVPLAFVLDRPDEVATAWLHVRTQGERTYHRIQLEREHDLYLRGEIPATRVAAPGLEYFVEIARTDGKVGTAAGSPARPLTIEVAGPSLARHFTGARDRSRITLRSSYVDFGNLDRRAGDRRDRFALFEADVRYQLGGAVRGVHAGFGSYQGAGGFADRVYDARSPAPAVGFNYGYGEFEVGPPGVPLGLIGRVVVGVGHEGFAAGLEGRVRFGEADGTNLSLGASRLAELGFLSDARLQVASRPDLPIGLSVGVTDQPNHGEVGVVCAGDVGWRLADWFTPTVRLSYEARTVVHAGLGAGLALVFGW